METTNEDQKVADSAEETANPDSGVEKTSISEASLLAISSLLKGNKNTLYGIYQSLSNIETRMLGYVTNEAAAYRHNLEAIRKLVKKNEEGLSVLSDAVPNAFSAFLEQVSQENIDERFAPYNGQAMEDSVKAVMKSFAGLINEAKDLIATFSEKGKGEQRTILPQYLPLREALESFMSQVADVSNAIASYRKGFQDIRSTINMAHNAIAVAKDTLALASKKGSAIGEKFSDIKKEFRGVNASMQKIVLLDTDIRTLIETPFPLDAIPLFEEGMVISSLTDEGFAIVLLDIAKKRDPLQRLMAYAELVRQLQEEIFNKEEKSKKLLDRMRRDNGQVESEAARQLRIKMQTAIDLLKKRQSKVLGIFFKGRKEILRKIIASTMEIDKCHKRVTRTCPLAVEADRNNIDSSLRVLEELNERHTHSTESL